MADNVARRSGWVTFAGIAALIAGGYNASAESPRCPTTTPSLPKRRRSSTGSTTAWGWFWLIVGIAQLITGVLIPNRNMWGLWLGGRRLRERVHHCVRDVRLPLWAIAVLTLDFLVLFALLTQSEEFTY